MKLHRILQRLDKPRFTPCDAEADRDVRLLLMDFDGTLADTREANFRAYQEVLGEVGCEISEEEYDRKFFGMRCLEFMATQGFSPAECERMRQRKIALYPRHFGSVRLNVPLWDLAQEFRAAGGRAWIVSTGSRDNILNVMRHLGIEGGVDGILTGADIANAKPAPDGFLKAMAAEGAAPSETLVFEDSEIGIEAAHRSGAPYVVVKL